MLFEEHVLLHGPDKEITIWSLEPHHLLAICLPLARFHMAVHLPAYLDFSSRLTQKTHLIHLWLRALVSLFLRRKGKLQTDKNAGKRSARRWTRVKICPWTATLPSRYCFRSQHLKRKPFPDGINFKYDAYPRSAHLYERASIQQTP